MTHHRLENKDGKLVAAGPLEEPLIVRPTSEMIIGDSFSKWVQSWRDLPLLINQWANVVRWEMRPRLFLRTAEFLWQEGHTVHATFDEAEAFTYKMLLEYQSFLKDMLALAPYVGKKSEGEKFPGAHWTYTLEAMMQDGKALQCGTSHNLGQTFAKASGIKFLSKEGQQLFAYTTSWGMTTRTIGALIMSHGDDDGLRLPPAAAPWQVVFIPYATKDGGNEVVEACERLASKLREKIYRGKHLSVQIDMRELRGGEKSWDWVKKGAPIRIEVGARDLAEGVFPLYKRTDPKAVHVKWSESQILENMIAELDTIHHQLYEENIAFRDKNTHKIETREELDGWISKDKPGFALVPFAADVAAEEKLKEDLGLTVRCFPAEFQDKEAIPCLWTGQMTSMRAIVARSY